MSVRIKVTVPHDAKKRNIVPEPETTLARVPGIGELVEVLTNKGGYGRFHVLEVTQFALTPDTVYVGKIVVDGRV